MADFESLGKQFCEFYYKTFDENRAQLAPLYREHSMLTFEGNQLQGVHKIVEKLQSLPFQKVQHRISTLDAHPSSVSGDAVLVMVTGELVVDEEQQTMRYSQVFNLLQDGGNYYVLNDIFRLNYG
ncbi:Nuclear transport factor 2 [Savitreella phatthalungensis]